MGFSQALRTDIIAYIATTSHLCIFIDVVLVRDAAPSSRSPYIQTIMKQSFCLNFSQQRLAYNSS